MKKIFSFLAIALLVMIPMSTNAATNEIVLENGVIPCKETLNENEYQCAVKMRVTGGSTESITVNITTHNATLNSDSIEAASGWNADISAYPTVTFTKTDGGTGEFELFTFVYTKATNGEDCYVTIDGKSTKSVVTKDTDTPVENEQTGVTLPYIFLGAALLIAGYAFVATKNKSKMFKI